MIYCIQYIFPSFSITNHTLGTAPGPRLRGVRVGRLRATTRGAEAPRAAGDFVQQVLPTHQDITVSR